ncbi:hypothetical protein AHAS_Ahas07G0155400 [Arachis hypogaea]
MFVGNNQIQVAEGIITCVAVIGQQYCPDITKCRNACKFFHFNDLTYAECIPNKGCACTFINPDQTKPCPHAANLL